MRRFFQSAGPGADGVVVLEGSEAHHAAQVIRLAAGEHTIVMDGRGGEFICTVLSVTRRQVRLQVTQTRRHEPAACRVRLVPAVTKGKSFEVILQKAVELGAAEIQPLITEHVVARPAAADLADKQAKWQQVVVEAVKQCGAPWLPRVLPPALLPAALSQERETELVLVAALTPDALHPRGVLEAFSERRGRLPKSISMWIGPEGDFTAGELHGLLLSGAKPVSLGGNVLRSETAALYALSVLAHELSFPRGPRAIGPAPGTSGRDGVGA